MSHRYSVDARMRQGYSKAFDYVASRASESSQLVRKRNCAWVDFRLVEFSFSLGKLVLELWVSECFGILRGHFGKVIRNSY